jgi:hypothetical protein
LIEVSFDAAGDGSHALVVLMILIISKEVGLKVENTLEIKGLSMQIEEISETRSYSLVMNSLIDRA